MSERDLDANYVTEWGNEANQCQHCASFKSQNGKHICQDSSDKSFEEILEANGEISPEGHCDYFQSLD
jgi:recombinational DNA repair protein RecR